MEKIILETLKLAYENYPITTAILVVMGFLARQLYVSNKLVANLLRIVTADHLTVEKLKEACISRNKKLTRYFLDENIPAEPFPGGDNEETKDECGTRKFPLD